jgi:alkylhydroperoxidase family enzyme
MRLGLDEQGVTELMAAADHARGLAKLAAGLRLEADVAAPPAPRSFPPAVDPARTEGRLGALLDEIRSWAEAELGLDRIPALWLGIAHHPAYLEAVFRREQALMTEGRLGRLEKRLVAYAVAVNVVAPYMIDWYATALRRLGLDAHGFVEALAVIDYFNNLNTLADGMDIESDIRPYGTYD